MDFEIDIGEMLRFADFGDAWFDSRPLALLGEAIVEDARIRLEDETKDPRGRRWQAWSENYAKTRTPSDKLMYDSGDLADSLEVRMRGDTMRIESDVPYAAAHQYGYPEGNLPARPYAGLSRVVEKSMSEILDSDLDRRWQRAR